MEQHLIHSTATLNNSGTVQSRTDIVRSSKIILNSTDALSSQLVNTGCEYIIVNDFDLDNGTDITIPNNCTLNFLGGSITGGTITLQNTKLEGDVKWIGTTISGSCTNDILTPQIFGAYPSVTEDETNKTQHTLAFENLARVIKNQSTISKTVYISGGHYAINKKINIESDCKLYGDGNVTVLDLYEGKGGLYFGKSSGESEALNCTITQDVSKFDTNITVDDTSELNAGDFIILVDTVDGSFNTSRAYYRTCECLKVKKIQNNTVYFDSVVYGDYYVDYGTGETTSLIPTPAHRTVISKFYPNVYLISDINIYSHEHENASPQTYYSLQIKGFYDSEFNNISVENHGNSVSANISLGVNYKVDHSSFRNFATYTGDAYGLAISHSQNFYVSSSTFRADSHALATGGATGLTALINRNFIYDNLFFETSENGLEEAYDYKDLDVHANAEYYKFINISAPHTSCDTGGYNVIVEGCKFYTISPSFNLGDFTIRKCELFGENGNMLFSNADRQNYNGHNSVIIEDCIIHEYLRLDFQDPNLDHEYFDFLVLKNNIIHSDIEARRGRIDFISLDNNIFTHGSFTIPGDITANNVSIKNNVFQNGMLFLGLNVGTDRLADGVVNGNTIILKETRPGVDTQCVLSLYGFRGNVTNNVIMSYLDDNYELISASYKSDIQVFDNFLQKGVGSTEKALILSIRKSNVICERNKHNSIRSSIINVSEYSGGLSRAFSDYNNVFNGDTAKWQAFSSTGIIGKLSYIKKDNKILYAGIKERGSRVAFLGVYYQGNTDTAIIANTLTYGRSYLVIINNSGSDYYSLYFSKYNRTDPEFSEDNMMCVLDRGYVGQHYEFKAEDPAEYPYLYAKTTATSGAHIFSIFENNIVCEIDGAAYGTLRRGTTAQRPNYRDIYIGFKYWDTDLGKEITYTELTYHGAQYWREYDGAIAGVLRSGTTSQRPTGLYNTMAYSADAVPYIYVGFRYYDTDLGQELYASAIAADGTVTWTEMTDADTTYKLTIGSTTNGDSTNGTSLGTLGTAALKDVPGSGDASNTQVVLGSDSRLANNVRVTIEKTWSELKALRDNSTLIPGQFYRITDFVTTTAQDDTLSAGHGFDIIVRADSVNVLNETAYAALHSGDTYFANSKLEAWELKYCIDNDTTRFAWADSTNGKGVIYYMKDEWQNECSYDFKNIQYKLFKTTDTNNVFNGYWAIDTVMQAFPETVTIDETDYIWAYTFYYDNDGVIEDTSVTVGMIEEDGGIFSNVIKECYDDSTGGGGIKLNRIVFCSNMETYRNFFGNSCERIVFGNSWDNTFGNLCSSSTFGNSCSSNMFGYNCGHTTFGTGCNRNTLGDNCYSNTFGTSCISNTLGDGCYYNTFGTSCWKNTFGESCYHNTFGNNCHYNTFGYKCDSNTLSYNCYYNTFGNLCNSNTFGDGCYYNTFGNSCYSNTFGTSCWKNTFGESCNHIKFGTSGATKNYCKYIIVENGNQYIYLNCSATTSNSSYFQNVKITQGVNNTSTYKTITHTTAGDAFQTEYKATNSQTILI